LKIIQSEATQYKREFQAVLLGVVASSILMKRAHFILIKVDAAETAFAMEPKPAALALVTANVRLLSPLVP